MKDKNIEIDLLTPLWADFQPSRYINDPEAWQKVFGDFYMDGSDLMKYKKEIQRKADRNNVTVPLGEFWNLMKYFCGSPVLVEKVKSAVISVKERDGVLYGCTTLLLKDFLEPEEKAELYEEIMGSYSEGWGEDFLQHPLEVKDGILYLHFYPGDDVQFEEVVVRGPTEPAKIQDRGKRPILKLADHDEDIFTIIADACRLLYANGQFEEADQMVRRIQDNGLYGYIRTLMIVSQYVETELSVPTRPQSERTKKPAKENRER